MDTPERSIRQHGSRRVTRRHFITILGAGTGLALATACGQQASAPAATAAPTAAPAKPTTAPQAAAPAAQSAPQATTAPVFPTAVQAAPAATSAQAQAAAQQRLVIGMGSEPTHLDPMRSNDSSSQSAYNLIFDRLVTLDASLKPIPAAAESWTTSDDGLTYTFTLRNGITFTDGSPLTSEDVKFSFDRILDPANASDKRSFISMIKQVEAVDPRTVRMTLGEPYAPFLYQARQHILPKKIVEQMGEQFTRKPVGSGPFKVDTWNTNDRLILKRNDAYWLAKPKLEEVVIRPIPDQATQASNLQAGDVDIIETVNAASWQTLQADKNLNVLTVPSANYEFIGFSQMGKLKPLSDKRFRQAIALAVDYDAVVKALYPRDELATRAFSTIPPSWFPGEDAEALKALMPKKDTAKAKALLDELVADGTMPADYTIKMIVNDSTDRKRIGEVVVTSLKALGRQADLQVMEWGAYLARLRENKYDELFMLSTIPQAPDPDASLNWLFYSQGTQGKFLGLPADTDLDKKILQARASRDQQERDRLYNDCLKQVIGDYYHIPQFWKNIVVAHNKKVDGLQPSPLWDWNLVTSFSNVGIVQR